MKLQNLIHILISFLCLCFSIPAQAKLGETTPQLIKRFGKSYTTQSGATGETYRFRSETFSIDVLVSDGVSVAETYFSDHPLSPSGEPPNDIVQAILKKNVPGTKWLEIEAASFGADYALQSSNREYIAFLRYKTPQPEGMVWTMVIGNARVLSSFPLSSAHPDAVSRSTGQSSTLKSATSASGHVSVPASSPSVATKNAASAAEAQRNLDAAAKSGHVGKAIQQLADQQQLTEEIKNEWPLPLDLMPEWKHVLIGDADNSGWTHATFLNDHAIEQLRQMFNIPKDEEIYGCYPRIDTGQVITDVSGFDSSNEDAGFEAVVTVDALYLNLLRTQHFVDMNNKVYEEERHVAEPVGLFRISHSAFLATDTFGYNGKAIPFHDKRSGNDVNNCIHIFGAWMTDGKLVFDFGKSGLADCTQTDDGRLIVRTDADVVSPLQGFLASIFKVDVDFAIKAARQKHLQRPNQAQSGPSTAAGNPPANARSGPSAATGNPPSNSPSLSDPLAGYLGVPWGSSFAEVKQKLAAKAAGNYQESHFSEGEWNRGYREVVEEIRYFMGWNVPVRPPLSFFTFSDETGVKKFLFNHDRFYAVTNLSDRDWVEKNGIETFRAMCRKYGQPTLQLVRAWAVTNDNPAVPRWVDYRGDMIRAVWENDSGVIFSPLKATKNEHHKNIHPFSDAYVLLNVPGGNSRWSVRIQAAGFVPPNATKDSPVILKQPGRGPASNGDVKVKLPLVPTARPKGKLLALIVHIEWSTSEDSAIQSATAKIAARDCVGNSFKPMFSAPCPPDILAVNSYDYAPGQSGNYAPGQAGAEWIVFIDVPVNMEDAVLQIETPEIIDLAGNKVQTEGTQIIDLEQTTQQWVCVGKLTEKEMEQYQFSIAGATTYGSKPIWTEMVGTNQAERGDEEQKKKEAEKKQHKELKEKF